MTAAGLLDPAYVSTHAFPPDVTNVEAREARLRTDVVCQVLDLENLSRSRWEQVEELEAIDRGELMRGRQVVRLPVRGEGEEGGDAAADEPPGETQQPAGQRSQAGAAGQEAAALAAAGSKNATHRLVLQDCKGQKVFGLELGIVDKIAVGRTNIGEKILIKSGTLVARGTVLLQPSNCVVLGGKVDAWQKAWLHGRLARLREAVGANRPD
jgi:RecQ-mediated genome instability protein 1